MNIDSYIEKDDIRQHFLNWCLEHELNVVIFGGHCITFLVDEASKNTLFSICKLLRECLYSMDFCEISFHVDFDERVFLWIRFDPHYLKFLFQFIMSHFELHQYFQEYDALMCLLRSVMFFCDTSICKILDKQEAKYLFFANTDVLSLGSDSPYIWERNNIRLEIVKNSQYGNNCNVLSLKSEDELLEYNRILGDKIELKKARHEFQ